MAATPNAGDLEAVKNFVSGVKWHGHPGRVSSRAGSPCHRLTQNSLQPRDLSGNSRQMPLFWRPSV